MRIILFGFILFISACSSQKKEDCSKMILQALQEKNIDSLNYAVPLQLKMYEQEDSISAYIKLCSLITDTLIVWKQIHTAVRFAMLAASKETSSLADTSDKKMIGRISLNCVKEYFNFNYNDTCVSLAETAYRNAGSPAGQTNMCQNLGIMYHILGDKNKAALYYDLCYTGRLKLVNNNTSISTAKGNTLIAVAIINKLKFFNEYGEYDSTILYAGKALRLDSLQNKRIALLQAYLAEALFYTGNTGSAASMLQQTLQLLYKEDKTDDDIKNRLTAVLSVKAALLSRQKNYKASTACLQQALAENNFNSRYAGKVLQKIACNYTALGDADSAAWYAHLALRTVIKIDSTDIFSLPLTEDVYPENTIQESADALAEAFILKYNITDSIRYAAAAVKCYDISFTTENGLLNDYAYDVSKLVLLAESRRRSEKAIALCYRLLQKSNDTAWAQKAFEFAEGNKAVVLLQSLKQNMAANKLLQNDSAFQKLQSLKLQSAFAAKSIAENNQRDTSGNRLLIQKLNSLQNNILLSQSLLIKNNPAYKTILQIKDSVNMPLIKEKIIKDDTAALLEFFSGDSTQYAFIVSKNKPVQVIKYSSGLDTPINNYLQFFAKEDSIAANPKAYQAAAFRLFSILGLAATASQYHRLIIIPDGNFSFIPFESLLYKQTSSSSLKHLPYLIEQCNISYGFSASTLLKQTEQKENSSHSMLAMAPMFLQNKKGLAPLPGTADELAVVKSEMPEGNYLINNTATLDAFRQYCGNAAYIHLATHAFANTTGAEPQIEFADSTLYLNELYAMPLHANLAVLSACETGIGKLEKSEGAMSMARGFYYAGVPHIITSLWQVNDASVNGLFKTFYAAARNENYADAFHQSKIKYLQAEQSSEKYSPYYWAGLIFIGNDDEADAGNSLQWWFLLPAVVLFVYAGKKMIKRKAGVKHQQHIK